MCRLASEGAFVAIALSADHRRCDLLSQDRVSLWEIWCFLG
jgi:hypothetical protein